MSGLGDIPSYRRFWAASTVSIFGSYLTIMALQVLAVVTLQATGSELGLLNAARWLPYLLLGLVAGVLVDRCRRRPVLVGADLGRAVLLCAIPALAMLDLLSLPALMLIVAAVGVLSLFFDAANQAFLPRLVPPRLLTSANARLEQSDAVAQTAGPLAAGALVKVVGAPVAVLVDAVSYLVSGLLLASVRVREPAPPPLVGRRSLVAELREGLSWVYRHRMLAPMAVSGHLWFFSHSVLTTVFVLYLLRAPSSGALGLSELQLGICYACGGVGAVLGGGLASRCGLRFGAGHSIVTTRLLMSLPWLLVPLAVPSAASVVLPAAALFAFWVLMGVEGPNEMAYRQSVTPDRLQSRMNATIRSLNRAMIVVGAPLGGLLADATTYRTALWAGIAGLVLSAAVLALSPFRHAAVTYGEPDSMQSSAPTGMASP